MSTVGDTLVQQLDALARLDRASLAERWTVIFGCPAPHRCQAPLLRGAIAWQLQMQNSGQSSGATARLVRSLRHASPAVSRSPGTRLLREWRGVTHQVTVTPKGFDYDGKSYRSLTAIARHITGTAWSGPLFFGLRA